MNTFRIFTLLIIVGFGIYVIISIPNSAKEYTFSDYLETQAKSLSLPDSIRAKNALNEVVLAISSLPELEGRYLGIEGRQSTQLDYQSILEKWATIDQLIKLTDHSNPLVRSMAFQSLKNKNYEGLKQIFEKHFNDDQTYKFHSGCIVGVVPVNGDFYRCIYPTLSTAEANSYKSKLLEKYSGTAFEFMFRYP